MFVLTKLGRLSIVVLVVAGVAFTATPAPAAKTICVGLVVDARSLNGPLSTDCTTVPDGSTGYDVLRAGGHTVGFRNDGLICTIDNRPADGCAAVDAEHYWAYFHRASGSPSWSYSNEGATTYKPDNGDTEGWVWRDGDSAKPPNVSYETICPQTASPSPKPSMTHAAPTATRTAAATPTASETAAQPRRHQRRPRHRTSTAVTATPTAIATTSSPAPRTIAAVNASRDDDSGPPWGPIAGALVVVVLGGVAALRWRRREVE